MIGLQKRRDGEEISRGKLETEEPCGFISCELFVSVCVRFEGKSGAHSYKLGTSCLDET